MYICMYAFMYADVVWCDSGGHLEIFRSRPARPFVTLEPSFLLTLVAPGNVFCSSCRPVVVGIVTRVLVDNASVLAMGAVVLTVLQCGKAAA